MRKLLIIFVVALQILMLAFMAGQREYVLRTGKTIYLRTVPVDPRDLFRGDYVTLRYEISTIAESHLRDELSKIANNDYMRDKKIYVVLKVDANDVADILYATDKKPQKGAIYICGRIAYPTSGFMFGVEYKTINVRYGIEAYFVEQGKGRQLEQRRRNNTPFREAEIALGSNGIAVIKGFR
ncbi:MAG: GDYXXLXY domain-containing protein [Phycisphaerae bacterium]|jgi:uncharacterized membrane-anchored protein